MNVYRNHIQMRVLALALPATLLIMLLAASHSAAKPVQLFNADIVEQIDDQWQPRGTPGGQGHGELEPVRIHGPRNGQASAMVVLLSEDELEHISVRVELSAPEGAGLDESDMQVRYGLNHEPAGSGCGEGRQRDDHRILAEQPPESFTRLPVWITAHIPADAEPADYRGEIVIDTGGQKLSAELELTVHGFTLPDPNDYHTFVNLIYSPDSVALRYDVPFWSDEHFEKLKRSHHWLHQAGQDVLYIPFVTGTHFGYREPVIRWIEREDGGYEPDFTALERYLEAWDEQVGEPVFVVLYIWDRQFGAHGNEPDRETATVRVIDPGTGESRDKEAPYFAREGSRAFWEPAITGAIERIEQRGWGGRLEQRGWDSDHVLLGIAHDRKPIEEVVAFFQDVAPDRKWNVISHARGYGLPGNPEPVDGLVIGYHEYPWNPEPSPPLDGRLIGGWDIEHPRASIARFHAFMNSNAASYRWLLEGTTGSDHRRWTVGVTRFQTDFFHIDGEGRLLDMSGWVNLMRNHDVLLAPGPEGALAKQKYQLLIEGVQDTEARIAIERVLADEALKAKLDDELIERARDILEWRIKVIREQRDARPRWSTYMEVDDIEGISELYAVAGEVTDAAGLEPGR